MEVDPHDELLSSLNKLLKDGVYSDLTVISSQDEYKVHKAIVCPRSVFFEKACNTPFKYEAEPKAPENPLAEVPEKPLEYETALEVEAAPEIPRKLSLKERKRISAAFQASIPITPNLAIHASIYTLGEKYGIPGLKTLALNKFRRENSVDFIHAIKEVFTSTVDEDRSMRDIVVEAIARHPELLDKKQFQDVVKSCELSFELMMKFRWLRQW
ncbi:Uncharacterized protein TPAR_00833 [Tolypocladium paradoxum]|uniref:BTB domain-containing protein n=1 Tax=Tolypocladium paradoxum TaxID=94208 RepID=A0A2S4L941_9HYPO|nr:Uncharacterized protein TPAR_00833 [Tolypocladium paradoxum]